MLGWQCNCHPNLFCARVSDRKLPRNCVGRRIPSVAWPFSLRRTLRRQTFATLPRPNIRYKRPPRALICRRTAGGDETVVAVVPNVAGEAVVRVVPLLWPYRHLVPSKTAGTPGTYDAQDQALPVLLLCIDLRGLGGRKRMSMPSSSPGRRARHRGGQSSRAGENLPPRELAKVVLPPYVIEPPDVLLIDAVHVVPRPPYHLRTLDQLSIQVQGTLPTRRLKAFTRSSRGAW